MPLIAHSQLRNWECIAEAVAVLKMALDENNRLHFNSTLASVK
jgi:hypothetical protein